MSNTNEQLAAAIVRANERLDWIEARDGKLPDDNYATIETTVGLVRALRGATAADTVTVDRASLVAHNLEKWEQIDQLQRAAAASERDGIQQAYAEQGIVWVQDQDTIERLTAERDEWKRINDSDNRSASRRVEALAADLAASEQRAAVLAAIGQRLYGQAMTFAIQFHQREGHAGLWADDKCGVGVCRSTLRQVTEWEALAAAAPSAATEGA